MKDVGSSPHPGSKQGSMIRKANKTGRIDKQLIEQEHLAKPAISLASSLKDTLGPHKAIIFGDPQPAVGGMSSQVTTETTLPTTTLFQKSPLVLDLVTSCQDSTWPRVLKSPEGTLSVLATDSIQACLLSPPWYSTKAPQLFTHQSTQPFHIIIILSMKSMKHQGPQCY